MKQKVEKRTEIRNQYNQVPHLNRYTIWKSYKTLENHTQENQEVSPFRAGDQKASRNKQHGIMKSNVKHK